ncbi:MAG: hypothetical protein QM489_00980 [Candidatus Izemoplasma sp.]
MKNSLRLVNETYDLALKLGLKDATDVEKQIFHKQLLRIVVTTIDGIKNYQSQNLFEMSNEIERIL